MSGAPTLGPEKPSGELMQYEIRSRIEVASLLRALHDEKVPVTVHFGDEFLVTNVIDVQSGNGILVCELGRDKAANARLLGSAELVFVAVLDHVKMQFHASAPQAHAVPEGFSVAIPSTVLRLQRREFFRVPLPRTRPLACSVAAPAGGARIELQVIELSGGGLGALVAPEKLRAERGMILADCQLQIPRGELLRCALEVRHTTEVTEGGRRRIRAGCRFVDLSAPMAVAIQRYVNTLQREWLARG